LGLGVVKCPSVLLQKSEAMRIAPEGAEEKYDQNRTLQVHDVTLPTPTTRV
jgi:hypothetical protein